MWKALIVAAFVLIPHAVAAQHPCDVPAPTTFREPASKLDQMKVSFCFQRDDPEPVGFILQINDEQIDLGILEPQTPPNANGEQFYETGTMTLWPGVLTIRAYTALVNVGAPSPAITLAIKGKPPS